MPDDHDRESVTYGRWQAEHEDLERRVAGLEQAMQARRERQWSLELAFLTGLVLPLILIAVAALITARGR